MLSSEVTKCIGVQVSQLIYTLLNGYNKSVLYFTVHIYVHWRFYLGYTCIQVKKAELRLRLFSPFSFSYFVQYFTIIIQSRL